MCAFSSHGFKMSSFTWFNTLIKVSVSFFLFLLLYLRTVILILAILNVIIVYIIVVAIWIIAVNLTRVYFIIFFFIFSTTNIWIRWEKWSLGYKLLLIIAILMSHMYTMHKWLLLIVYRLSIISMNLILIIVVIMASCNCAIINQTISKTWIEIFIYPSCIIMISLRLIIVMQQVIWKKTTSFVYLTSCIHSFFSVIIHNYSSRLALTSEMCCLLLLFLILLRNLLIMYILILNERWWLRIAKVFVFIWWLLLSITMFNIPIFTVYIWNDLTFISMQRLLLVMYNINVIIIVII